MTVADFSGETVEPMVGQVTALRSFRLTDDGFLLPLTEVGGEEPWPAETASAICRRGKSHQAPDPDCQCGFYAYGHSTWVESAGLYSWSLTVLAAVHCVGRLVGGEKGIRATKMRIAACYVNKHAPQSVMERLRENYPDVEFYTSRRALFSAHPTTVLSSYIRPSFWGHIDGRAVAKGLTFLAPIFFLATFLFYLLTGDPLSISGMAGILFSFSVWSPFMVEMVSYLTTGLSPDAYEANRRFRQAPWRILKPSASLFRLAVRLGVIFGGLAIVITAPDTTLLSWQAVPPILGMLLGIAIVVLGESRKVFPLSKTFPLVPRTRHVEMLRDSLAGDVHREAAHVEHTTSEHYDIAFHDMGEYAVAMVHFNIVSDPEDHPPAKGIGPTLVRAIQDMATRAGVDDKWVAYIASDESTLRVLTKPGVASPPIPMAEIEAILPIPTLAWCPPGVRPAYVNGLYDDEFAEQTPPFLLPARYRARQGNPRESFSNPQIAPALNLARKLTEQAAYRDFKGAEANLPEEVQPVASPTLPSRADDSASLDESATKTTILQALYALMNVEPNPVGAGHLVFAMGELIDALDVLGEKDYFDINFDIEEKAPSRNDQVNYGLKAAHFLLLGPLGFELTDLVTPLSYPTPEGWVYKVQLEEKKGTLLSASVFVRDLGSESGASDDSDTLSDTD